MLKLLQTLLIFAWEDFYGSTSYTKYKLSSSTTNFASHAYIFDSKFDSISATIPGSAISYSSSSPENKLLIEYTTFLKCTTTDKGGAVFFAYNGQCVYSHVCGSGCYSSDLTGNFDYIEVDAIENYKNYIFSSSICFSRPANDIDRTLCHYSGHIILDNSNISHNTGGGSSGIYSSPTTKEEISFTTFSNNTGHYDTSIYLYEKNMDYTMKTCNIIYNNQLKGSIIETKGSLIVTKTCILKNKAPTIIKSYTTFILDNCAIDFSSTGTIINKPSSLFINGLNHFGTIGCQATYDNVGSLTPQNTPALSKSFGKQKRILTLIIR